MRRPGLEVLVLLVPQPAVDVAALEQLVVRADIVDPAALEHEDRVGRTSDDRRCEMMISVRPSAMRSRLALTIASLSASSALVASSRIRMRGSVISARAIARRWRWPPDRLGEPS